MQKTEKTVGTGPSLVSPVSMINPVLFIEKRKKEHLPRQSLEAHVLNAVKELITGLLCAMPWPSFSLTPPLSRFPQREGLSDFSAAVLRLLQSQAGLSSARVARL